MNFNNSNNLQNNENHLLQLLLKEGNATVALETTNGIINIESIQINEENQCLELNASVPVKENYNNNSNSSNNSTNSKVKTVRYRPYNNKIHNKTHSNNANKELLIPFCNSVVSPQPPPLLLLENRSKPKLSIASQPELRHRARYQTERSRGCIKDREGKGFPSLELVGYSGNVRINIFASSEDEPMKAHPLYEVYGVTSSLYSFEENRVNQIKVVQFIYEVINNNKVVIPIDCIGLMKLRNIDVERKTGNKNKSKKVRLLFHIDLLSIGQTLQCFSDCIECHQSVGQCEITFMSHNQCFVTGGQNIVLIGKNFLKNSKVFFREIRRKTNDEEQQDENIHDVLWQAEAKLIHDHFQPVHIVCTVPPYLNVGITSPVDIFVVVVNGSECSDPQKFTYLPDPVEHNEFMDHHQQSENFTKHDGVSNLVDLVELRLDVSPAPISAQEADVTESLTIDYFMGVTSSDAPVNFTSGPTDEYSSTLLETNILSPSTLHTDPWLNSLSPLPTTVLPSCIASSSSRNYNINKYS